MKVQTSEQNLLIFLILGKSRLPPKKSFITSTTGKDMMHLDFTFLVKFERFARKLSQNFGGIF